MIGPFYGEYRWLSNFWPAVVELEGVAYKTVEHAYQAWKVEIKYRPQIKACITPGDAKRLARTLPLRETSEQSRIDIMTDLLRQKFQHFSLRKRLRQTGTAQLVEINYWNDTFWGVCRGVGQNQLGKILMRIRDEIA